MKMIRDHGQAKKYYHDIEGYNGRLDSIQAGWLSVKLRHLAKWNESRRTLAHRYHELLAKPRTRLCFRRKRRGQKVSITFTSSACRIAKRCRRIWQKRELELAFTIPFHCICKRLTSNLAYKKGDFPVTERVAAEIVSLPMFPQLSPEQQDVVVAKVKDFVGAKLTTSR